MLATRISAGLTLAALGSAAWLLTTAAVISERTRAAAPARLEQLWVRQPLSFEPASRVGSGVSYLARGAGYSARVSAAEMEVRLQSTRSPHRASRSRAASERREARIRIRLAGAASNAETSGRQPRPGSVNYLLGRDPSRWRTGLTAYQRVEAKEVYPGIDVAYYGNQQRLEYDFLVAPGADPRTIRLEIEGAAGAEIDPAGALLLHTAGGDLRQPRPVIYQQTTSGRREVAGGYVLAEAGEPEAGASSTAPVQVSFALGAYDRNRPLVIDPVVEYSGVIGGALSDVGTDIAVDGDGNAYLVGETFSADFPVTAGAGQTTFQSSSTAKPDAFVVKLSPTGERIYSTYLGGANLDSAEGVGVDALGRAYITGTTQSANFPVQNALQGTLSGPSDAFVTCLNAAGSALVFSTYLGSGGADAGADLVLAPNGDIVLGGRSWLESHANSLFPLVNAFDSTGYVGAWDGFVTRMTGDGAALIFSTYLGGGHTEVLGVAVSPTGSVAATGYTQSSLFPTHNPLQAVLGLENTSQDAFAARFDPAGTIVYSTYLGGKWTDAGMGVALDAEGCAYLTGGTGSREFPTTEGAFSREVDSDNVQAYLTKLAPDGGSIRFSTVLGGTGGESFPAFGVKSGDVALDADGGVVICGSTDSTDFPVTLGALRPGTGTEVFVARFQQATGVLLYSTLYGGSQADFPLGLALAPNGRVWIGGFTGTTAGALNGSSLVVKLSDPPAPASPSNLSAEPVSSTKIRLAWTDNSSAETGFEIERRSGTGTGPFTLIASVGANTTEYVNSDLVPNRNYTYRVIATQNGCLSLYSNTVSMRPLPATPSDLIATALTPTQVELTWTDNTTSFTAHRIERSTDGTSFTEIGMIDRITAILEGRKFSDTKAVSGTRNYYRVRAQGELGALSPYSEVAEAVTAAEGPAAPSMLQATLVEPGRVDLTWADNSNNETGFRVQRKAGTGEYVQVAQLAAGTTAYSDTAAADDTTYAYRVQAVNGDAVSPFAGPVTLITTPRTPSDLGVSVTWTDVMLTWGDGSSTNTAVKVEWQNAGGAWETIATVPDPNNWTTISGLAPNTVHTFRVRSTSPVGDSRPTAPVSKLNGPVFPDQFSATVVSTTRADLTWHDANPLPCAHEITLYEMEESGGAVFVSTISFPAGTSAHSYTDLKPGTRYRARIRGVNATTRSFGDNSVDFTTHPLAPATPSNLTFFVFSQNRIDLDWTNSNTYVDGYEIERKTGTEEFAKIATTGRFVKEYSSTGLTSNTTYWFRVRAYNSLHVSGWSDVVQATTHPDPAAAPTNLLVSANAPGRLDLSWTDASTNEDGFKIERKTGAGNFTVIATLGAGVSSYLDTGLSPLTAYTYRVFAFNAVGGSAYSNQASGTTLPPPPVPPSDLMAFAVSQNRIDLTWNDKSSDETGFQIERKTGAGEFVLLAAIAANTSSYQDMGLSAATTYVYRVCAYNVAGSSEFAGPVQMTTLPNPPSAPTDLMLGVVSQNQINLSWTDTSDNETGFEIQRKTGSGEFVLLVSVASGTTSYESTGLSANTSYSYRVRAVNAGGASNYTDSAGATTLPNPPSAPSGLTLAVVSQNQINLSWTDTSDNETGFEIQRKTGNSEFFLLATVEAGTTSYADSGLNAAAGYTYRVRAVNAGGASAFTDPATATTLPNPPSAPSGLTLAVISQNQINSSWTDTSDNETGFEIHRRIGNGEFFLLATVESGTTTFSSTGLAANTSYSYRVRAVNAGGESAFSDPATAITLPNPPSAPSGLTLAVISQNQINLSWTDTSDNETAFELQRKRGSGEFMLLASIGGGTASYADMGLLADTTYTYRVRAVNAGGESAFTDPAGATTLPEAPGTPTQLLAFLISRSEARLTWNAAGGEVGFQVERKTNGGEFFLLSSTSAGSPEYTDSNLLPDTTYSYRVRGFNAGGSSAFTDPAVVVTAPASPSGLAVSEIGASSVKLAWTDNSSTETGFRVERRTGGAGTFFTLAVTGAGQANYTDSGLQAHTEYGYRIVAINAGGDSDPSNTATALTLPAAPTGLTVAAVSQSRLDLGWTDASPTRTGHRIERSSDGTNFQQIGSVEAPTTTFSDSGLTANTPYHYRVRAFNATGNSAYSPVKTGTTHPNAPGTPGSLTAELTTANSATLSWSHGNGTRQGYRIERAEDAGAYAVVATTGEAATSHVSSGLLADRIYRFRVRAFNAGGESAPAGPAQVTTPPAAPSGVGLVGVTSSSLRVVWIDNSSTETGFRIERKVGGGDFQLLTQTGAGAISFLDESVAGNTQYTYRVAAFSLAGPSQFAEPKSQLTPPSAPFAFNVQPQSTTELRVAWMDGNPVPCGHRLERATGAGAFEEILVVPAGILQILDGGRQPNTAYRYRVRAVNATGNSGFTAPVEGTTYPSGAGSLEITGTFTNRVDLRWASGGGPAAGHQVERSTDGGNTYSKLATVPAGTLTYSDSSCQSNTPYSYRVASVNGSGVGGHSNVVSALTLPAGPTGLTVTALSTVRLAVEWSDGNPTPAQHRVERAPGTSSTFTHQATLPSGTTRFEQDGLAPNTTYTFRVRAFNASGNSDFAGPVSGNTMPLPPAPTGLQARVVSATRIDLTWSDTVPNETGFEVERRTRTGSFTRVAQLGPNATTYMDTAMGTDSAYIYRIRVAANGSWSAYSAEVEAELPQGGKLTVAPAKVAFGTIRHRRVVRKTVKLTNSGRGPLAGTVGSLASPFRIVSGAGSFHLERRKSLTITVELVPAAPGTFAGTLAITSTDPAKANLLVPVSATVR